MSIDPIAHPLRLSLFEHPRKIAVHVKATCFSDQVFLRSAAAFEMSSPDQRRASVLVCFRNIMVYSQKENHFQ